MSARFEERLELLPEERAAWRRARRVVCRQPAPLPAGVSPLEGSLQEMLLDHGHRTPLSTAARMADTVLSQQAPAIATSSPLPPEQWSAGTRSRAERDAVSSLEQLRAWLWAHTAQPNGDPWDAAAPDELDRAARDLAATLAGGTP